MLVKEFEEKSARREPCSEAEGREHHKVVGVEGLGKVNTGKTCTAKQEEQGAVREGQLRLRLIAFPQILIHTSASQSPPSSSDSTSKAETSYFQSRDLQCTEEDWEDGKQQHPPEKVNECWGSQLPSSIAVSS